MKKLLLILSIAAATLTSCKKEETQPEENLKNGCVKIYNKGFIQDGVHNIYYLEFPKYKRLIVSEEVYNQYNDRDVFCHDSLKDDGDIFQ